jgi:hypothetical protein
MAASRLLVALLLVLGCAQNGAGPAGDPLGSGLIGRVAPGDATLTLELRNEAASLGSLISLAAVLDGVLVFREGPWRPGQHQALAFATTPGRHHLCVAASYQGSETAPGPFEVRATRLVDLLSGSSVPVRVSLREQLAPTPYATAEIEGGASYAAATGATDRTKDVGRIDEICAVTAR